MSITGATLLARSLSPLRPLHANLDVGSYLRLGAFEPGIGYQKHDQNCNQADHLPMGF